MSSGTVCQHCGTAFEPASLTCARCGKPRPPPQALTHLVSAQFPVEDAGLPTAAMPVPYPLPKPSQPKGPPPEPMSVPTAMMPAQFPQPSRKPSQPAVPKPEPDALPTTMVAAPFPVKDESAGETLDTSRTAAPFPVESEPPPAATSLVAAPFPLASDTARTVALFPAEKQKEREKRREEQKEKEKAPSDTADTGRVVAPYRTKTNPDADTGRVAVPFRQVEAPFPVAEPPQEDGTGRVSVPLAVSKLAGVPSSSSLDDDPSAPVRAVPFPIESPAAPPAAPPKRQSGLGKRERTLVMVFGGIFIALGLVTVWLVGFGTAPRRSVVREAQPLEPVRSGYVRITALCGGMQIPAKLTVNGMDKGETPVELLLPTAFPPGKHELELHLAARIGDPADAVWAYHLPLDPTQPGKAIDIELNGCGGY